MKLDSKWRSLALGIGLVVPICLLACTAISVISDLQCRQDFICYDQRYLEALRDNQIEAAKNLVVPEQWARLEQWAAKHKVPVCEHIPREDDINATNYGGGGGPFIDPMPIGHILRAEASYNCRDSHYDMRVENIKIQKQASGWKILGWGDVCERVNDQVSFCDISR